MATATAQRTAPEGATARETRWLHLVAVLTKPLNWLRGLVGRDAFEPNDAQAETGFREIIALQGLVLGLGIVLLYGIRELGMRELDAGQIQRHLIAYLLANLLPFGAMVGMVCADCYDGKSSRRRLYNHATRRCLQIALLFSGVFVAALTISVYADRAPGQITSNAALQPVVVADYQWSYDGTTGLVASATVPSKLIEDHPSGIAVRVELASPLKKAWEIWRIDLVQIAPNGMRQTIGQVAVHHEPTSISGKSNALFHNLQRHDGSYRVEVYLHPASDSIDLLQAKSSISEEQALLIMAQATSGPRA